MKKIINTLNIKEALIELLSFDGAMDIIGAFDSAQLKYVPSSEKQSIARYLCGMAGFEMAMDFMDGSDNEELFLGNVSYCGPSAVPFILRAINIRFVKINALKESK